MSKPAKIACIGEVMIELIAGQSNEANIGVAGDTYNTSVYLSKITNPGNVVISYVSALGTDSFSKRILSEIEQNNIETSHIELRENHMPGLYAIETDDQGERSFSYWRGQSAAKTLFQEPCEIKLQSLMAFDLIYISGISMAILPAQTREIIIEFLKTYRQSGGKLAYDSNYRPGLWENVETARNVTMDMWSLTDIALPSLDDEMLLFSDTNQSAVLKRLANAGVIYGALKRGMDGPTPIREEAYAVTFKQVANVIDTTAAGDSFNAGFLSAHIAGKSLKDAMISGHELASKVITANGAIVEI